MKTHLILIVAVWMVLGILVGLIGCGAQAQETIEKQQKEIDGLKAKLTQAEKQLQAMKILEGKLATLDKDLSVLQGQVKDKDAEIEAKNKQLEDLEAQKKELDDENVEFSTRSGQLSSKIGALEYDLGEIGKERDDLMVRGQRLQTEKESIQGELSQIKSDFNKMKEAYASYGEALRAEIEAQSKRMSDEMSRDRTSYSSQIDRLAKMNQDLEGKLKEVQPEESDSTEELMTELTKGLANHSQVTVTRSQNQIYISISDNILFDLGSHEIRKEAHSILRTIAEQLQTHPNRSIIVEGHTDDTPISEKGKNSYASNWELSVARATSVVHFLIDQFNLDPKSILAAGRGEFQPAVPNTTSANKATNRRVRIIVGPINQQTKDVFDSGSVLRSADSSIDDESSEAKVAKRNVRLSPPSPKVLRPENESTPVATDSYREDVQEKIGTESSTEDRVNPTTLSTKTAKNVVRDDEQKRRTATHAEMFDDKEKNENVEVLANDYDTATDEREKNKTKSKDSSRDSGVNHKKVKNKAKPNAKEVKKDEKEVNK